MIMFLTMFSQREHSMFANASILHSASAVAFSASIILLAAIIVHLCV